MKKNIPVIIAAISIIVFIVCAFLLFGKHSPENKRSPIIHQDYYFRTDDYAIPAGVDNHRGDNGISCIMELGILKHYDSFYQNVIAGDSAMCDFCKNQLNAIITEDVYQPLPSKDFGGR